MKHDRPSEATPGGPGLAERLERGEVVYCPACPFALSEEDRRLLLAQRLASRAHKNIGYDPTTGKVTSFLRRSPEEAQRLGEVLAAFSRTATAWLASALPRYAAGWQLDRVSLRPQEEATRKMRLTARNDLLHVDAFPTRPSHGARILRLFVNLNPVEPRVWVTSETFPQLLARFGERVGLPGRENGLLGRLGVGVLGLLGLRRRRSPYDAFMLRLHNAMKADADFQRDCPKREWHFPPGSTWLVITDTASHAVLRGRFALEHSYFVVQRTLALPAESPAALLERAAGVKVLDRAA
jgi:hypothetical protein